MTCCLIYYLLHCVHQPVSCPAASDLYVDLEMPASCCGVYNGEENAEPKLTRGERKQTWDWARCVWRKCRNCQQSVSEFLFLSFSVSIFLCLDLLHFSSCSFDMFNFNVWPEICSAFLFLFHLILDCKSAVHPFSISVMSWQACYVFANSEPDRNKHNIRGKLSDCRLSQSYGKSAKPLTVLVQCAAFLSFP